MGSGHATHSKEIKENLASKKQIYRGYLFVSEELHVLQTIMPQKIFDIVKCNGPAYFPLSY